MRRESLVLREDPHPDDSDLPRAPLAPIQGWIHLQRTLSERPEAGCWLELGGSFVSGRGNSLGLLDVGVARPLPADLLQRTRAQLEPLQGCNLLY